MKTIVNEHIGNSANKFPVFALGKVINSWKKAGTRETARLIRKNALDVARRYLNSAFDRKFHVDTAGLIRPSDLTCDGENRRHATCYEPTPLRTLKLLFSVLPRDLRNFTFVDFGSGKGRTILYASNFNFRRIIGVEFALELHEIAVRNIHSYTSRNQRCFDIRSLCIDAVNFSLPDDENCVLYFFDPFNQEVMGRVLDNIARWYSERPRKLILLYYHPRVSDAIERITFLRKTSELFVPSDLSGGPTTCRRKLAVYEN